MRLVTFVAPGGARLGALEAGDRQIVDLAAAQGGNADPAFASMQALIEAGPAALDRARDVVAAARRDGRGMIDAAIGQTVGAAAGAARKSAISSVSRSI